jgi:proline dehydrogenase
MVSFHNTETAFRHKSDKELRSAARLFSIISNPWLVSVGNSLATLGMSLGLPIRWIIKNTLFKQFVGGESIEECTKTIEQLASLGVGTILDYSVEGKTTEDGFDEAMQEIIRTIEKAEKTEAIPFSVFKVSGIGSAEILEKAGEKKPLDETELAAFERIKKRVENICHTAAAHKVRIFIDAEESWIQQPIDDMAEAMMERYNQHEVIVFNTLQMYRRDRLEYLKKFLEKAQRQQFKAGFKLVRGAYMEKERDRAAEKGYESPIQPDKSSTDRDFDAAVDLCIQHIDFVAFCVGTHNEESCLKLVRLMAEKGIPKNDPGIWFAQLLGMSDHISFNLSAGGYNVAKYVPYGPVKELIPYLSRRARENTSVKGQSGRELSLIKKELKRRKIQA